LPWVLLLDHEYSEHGLRWPLLKGRDRPCADAPRAAAAADGWVLDLALVSLHEAWSATIDARDGGRYGRRGRAFSDTEVSPDERIDREATLDFWVDADDRVGRRAQFGVPADDVAHFTETGPEHLVEEEYEGYMGNYGETLDHW
jgi:hypothetical protein